MNLPIALVRPLARAALQFARMVPGLPLGRAGCRDDAVIVSSNPGFPSNVTGGRWVLVGISGG